MSHWLLRRPLPYGDIQPSYAGKPWPYDKVFADPRLEANDVVYLAAAYDEIYGWGYVTKKESYRDPDLEAEALRITVTRPVIQQQSVLIIGMDREKIAAGLAVKYEKLLPYLALTPHPSPKGRGRYLQILGATEYHATRVFDI